MTKGLSVNTTYDAQEFLEVPGRDRSIRGTVTCPHDARGRIKLRTLGGLKATRQVSIRISAEKFLGSLVFGIGPGSTSCVIDSAGQINAQINMWRDAVVRIGEGTTINSARMIADAAELTIGKDNLWSDEIIIQTNDQHGLIDLTTDQVIGTERRFFTTEDHVWLGRRTLVMSDVLIGAGSTIGAGSVVTKSVGRFCIVAGNPARVVRENTTWSRSPNGFSDQESAWVSAHRPVG